MDSSLIVKSQRETFTLEDLTFDYFKTDSRYHASQNPNDEITLYKGSRRTSESQGFLSMALRYGIPEHVMEVKRIIEQGDHSRIEELFDRHTSYYRYTALLSTTFNPEQAQVFAPARSIINDLNKTIYQIKIRGSRAVIDCYDTGNCGSSKEVFILGKIFPEEISAIKINNEDVYSELMSSCGSFIKRFPDRDSKNRGVRDEKNWMQLP